LLLLSGSDRRLPSLFRSLSQFLLSVNDLILIADDFFGGMAVQVSKSLANIFVFI